jgi:hypothetical protein
LVRDFGLTITPALLISRSIWSWSERSWSAAARIDSSDVRSSSCTATSAAGVIVVIRSAACLPFSTLRTASTTRAPFAASAAAVS